MSTDEKKTAPNNFQFFSHTCNSSYILGMEEKKIDIQINSCGFGITRLERGSMHFFGTQHFVLKGSRPSEKACLDKFGKRPAHTISARKAKVENSRIAANHKSRFQNYRFVEIGNVNVRNWDEHFMLEPKLNEMILGEEV